MVQAAVTATSGRVPATVIGQLVDYAHEMLMHPVELLDGVPETLAAVGRTHRLVLITKGDLVHQTRKITTSGLEHHFEHVSVVLEKDPATYRRVLDEWGVDPSTFLFVGNSVRSDVLPVVGDRRRRHPCPLSRDLGPRGRPTPRRRVRRARIDPRAARLAGRVTPPLRWRPPRPRPRRRDRSRCSSTRSPSRRPQSFLSETCPTRWSRSLRMINDARSRVGAMFSRRFRPLIDVQI